MDMYYRSKKYTSIKRAYIILVLIRIYYPTGEYVETHSVSLSHDGDPCNMFEKLRFIGAFVLNAGSKHSTGN